MTPVPLWAARDRAKWTQMQLELRSGVDRTRIAKLEAYGGDPRLATHKKLEAAFRRERILRASEELVYTPERMEAAS